MRVRGTPILCWSSISCGYLSDVRCVQLKGGLCKCWSKHALEG
jgi:hypothetical protein